MENSKKSKKPIAIIAVIALLAVAAVVIFLINNGRLSASTMRMLRREGVVRLFEFDKEKTITDNLRLNAGNVLNTETSSLAGIALDDTKIVTINELSRAQFDQKGKKLDINLTDGSLFFEVTKKLDSDETFDIRTSTMVVGIRGTSGYVAADENGNDVVVITDGQVDVVGTNPVTGEVKTITVKAGQRVTCYLYNDRTTDSIMFELEDLVEEDLYPFIVKRLAENERLITLVCEDTGWSREKILGIADGSIQTDTMYAQETAPGADTAPDNGGDGNGDSEGSKNAISTGSGTGDGSNGGDAENSINSDGAVGQGDGTSQNAGNTPAAQTETAAKSGVKAYVASTDANGVMHLTNGTLFDPGYYARQNPDVVSEIGNDPYKLLEHYLAFAESENRYGTEAEQQQAQAEKDAAYQQFVNDLNAAYAEEYEAAKAEAAKNSGGGSDSGSDSRSDSSNSSNGTLADSGSGTPTSYTPGTAGAGTGP